MCYKFASTVNFARISRILLCIFHNLLCIFHNIISSFLNTNYHIRIIRVARKETNCRSIVGFQFFYMPVFAKLLDGPFANLAYAFASQP